MLKDPRMLAEAGVRAHLLSLASKYIDEMKCGKLWIKSCFRLLVPDLILLLEQAGGLEPRGCLKQGECYTRSGGIPCTGELLIERNPHICRSEHALMNAVNPEEAERYCSQLDNVCMVNRWDLTAQRLNGADFDGDLVLVIDEPQMIKGVDPDIPIVMDREDKVTAMEQADTPDARAEMILRTMNNLIGETSNCATAYHNKMPKTQEQRQVYESYIDLLSIINGKAIDYAKTGVFYQIPRNIAKYGRPLPYFMKYAGPYYAKLKEFSRSHSNMNRLCMELEKWDKTIRFGKSFQNFDYRIMLDPDITIPAGLFTAVEQIYLDFCREMQELGKEQSMIQQYDKYKEELEGWLTREQANEFQINWQFYYNKYQKACRDICPDPKVLANIAVLLCYEKYPNKNKKFIWRVAADGLLQNIRTQEAAFPLQDEQGDYEYLGKRYRLASYHNTV